MSKEIRVKCSLCYGAGKDGSCGRCMDGTQSLKDWCICRGYKVPKITYLPTGHVRIAFGVEQWAQFPDNFVGVLPDAFIFNPAWNRCLFTGFYIVEVRNDRRGKH